MVKDSYIDPFVLSLSKDAFRDWASAHHPSTWLRMNGFLTTSGIYLPLNSMSLGYGGCPH